MIKQIVDFSREIEHGTGIIDVFVLVDDPQPYSDILRSLMRDHALILSADGDTIRARYHEAKQEKLLSLLDDGWSFHGNEEPPKCLCDLCKVPCDIQDTNGPEIDPDVLQCQDQADKGLCGECQLPCDTRGEEQ